MADIMVNINSIQGDSTSEGYVDQIRCSQMTQSIGLATDPTTKARVDGSSKHAPITLTHGLDKASPKLRLAGLKGQNLGEVTITTLKMVDGTSQATEVIDLSDVYIVSVGTGVKGDTPNNADENPIEVFSLSYGSIRVTVNVYTDGSNTGSVAGGWDANTSTALS